MHPTMVEFWTMVWEKKFHAIVYVMLSLPEENEAVSIDNHITVLMYIINACTCVHI